MIDIRELEKSYTTTAGTTRILHTCTAHIPQGTIAAIVGKSGSGKSTLLNILAGIDTPDSGIISINGTVLTQLSEQARTTFRRTQIGFVFQAFHLLPGLTAIENILFQQELQSRLNPIHIERATHLLERLGIADKASHFPAQLSGGEQQRVAIARALIHKPSLILADEPTGNLDEATANIIMNIFINNVREHSMTAIIVTHSSDIAQSADMIFDMYGGTLHRRPTAP